LEITIRRGSSYWDMTIQEDEGTTTFDFVEMNRSQRQTVRRMVIEALRQKGYFQRRRGKPLPGNRRRARRASH